MTVAHTSYKKQRPKREPFPVCPDHGFVMFHGTTVKGIQYFYCPVEGCKKSHKRQDKRTDAA